MRRLRLISTSFLTMAALCLCAGTASATSVKMKLAGVGGNNAGGAYTYPYNFSINGSAPVALICDDYNNEVTIGETWQANVVGLLSGKGLFGNSSQTLLDYKAAGLIFEGILDGKVSANIGNFAIWGLFSTAAQQNSYFQTSAAAGIESMYLAMAKTAPNSAFNGLVLYTPIAGTQSSGGLPQEYIGYSTVPEPGSLALFGTGLISLGGIVRRKVRARA
jgi:hypothetical protein